MYSHQSCTKKDGGSRCGDRRNGRASEGRRAAERLPWVKDEGAERGVGGCPLPGWGRSQEAQRAARSTWGQERGEGGTAREQVQAFCRQIGHCNEGKIPKTGKNIVLRGILELKLQSITSDRKHLHKAHSVQLREQNRYRIVSSK